MQLKCLASDIPHTDVRCCRRRESVFLSSDEGKSVCTQSNVLHIMDSNSKEPIFFPEGWEALPQVIRHHPYVREFIRTTELKQIPSRILWTTNLKLVFSRRSLLIDKGLFQQPNLLSWVCLHFLFHFIYLFIYSPERSFPPLSLPGISTALHVQVRAP